MSTDTVAALRTVEFRQESVGGPIEVVVYDPHDPERDPVARPVDWDELLVIAGDAMQLAGREISWRERSGLLDFAAVIRAN